MQHWFILYSLSLICLEEFGSWRSHQMETFSVRGTGGFPEFLLAGYCNRTFWLQVYQRHMKFTSIYTEIVIKFGKFQDFQNFNLESFRTFRILTGLCPEICVNKNPWFHSQRPVTWSFYVFLNVSLNKCLSKQLRCRWFVTPWHPKWHGCYVYPPLCVWLFLWRMNGPESLSSGPFSCLEEWPFKLVLWEN